MRGRKISTNECNVYTELAPIYDYVMRHVNYRRWAKYVQTLFQLRQTSVSTILDVACGTGSLALDLEKLGYEVVGFDYSADMVFQAIAKARRADKQISFWTGDMTRFVVAQPKDAVVCLYDSINYLMETKLWVRAFENVFDVLKSHGLFVFDISTEKNSIRHFSNYKENDHGPGFSYTRESNYDKNTRVQTNKFTISWKNKPRQQFVETHHQIVLTIDEVKELIPSEKFETIGIYDNYTTDPANGTSERAHFLLQKTS